MASRKSRQIRGQGKRRRQFQERLKQRSLQFETLETRMLLTHGPRLVAIEPNDGQLLEDGDIRNVSPTGMTFRFQNTDVLDPNTLDGVRILNSGGQIIEPGYVGLGDLPYEIQMRFAQTLPDDDYTIEVKGTSQEALLDIDGDPFNEGIDLQIHFSLDLGAQILGVVPQPVSISGFNLAQSANTIEVYFNNDDLDPDDATNPDFYQLYFTGDTVDTGDDVLLPISSVTYDPGLDKATLIYGLPLHQLDGGTGPVGPGTFRLRIGTNEPAPLDPAVFAPTIGAQSDFGVSGLVITLDGSLTELEKFADSARVHVLERDFGVDPTLPAGKPLVTVTANRVLIEVNSFGTGSTAKDVVDAINLGPAASLMTASVPVAQELTSVITGGSLAPIVLTGLGSSFDTASDLGLLTNEPRLISSSVDAQFNALDYPGARDEPGHRDIPEDTGNGLEQHIDERFGLNGADDSFGLTTIRYNFKQIYGVDHNNEPLSNVITARQKALVRAAFDMWGANAGVQFIETDSSGLTIVTGDPTALNPADDNVANFALDNPSLDMNFIARVDPELQNGMLILDAAENWNDDFGGSYYETSLIGLGFLLGMQRAGDLPDANVMSFGSTLVHPGSQPAEGVAPAGGDVVHVQHLYRPDSNDLDTYRFEVDLGDAALTVKRTAQLTLETFAERQPNSSLLDTHLALYREVNVLDGAGAVIGVERELVGRNDNYFSNDSQVKVEVGTGIYYAVVSSTGNEDFNPNNEATGFGGTSQGAYDLRLDLRPQVADDNIIRDLDSAEGTAFDGDADGVPGGVYNFWFRVQDDPANTIFVDKSHATAPWMQGTLTNPYNNIGDALTRAKQIVDDPNTEIQPIVRIVGNAGADGDLSTLGDNLAYEIGFGTLPGQLLQDGTTMDVPRDVTVMIDEGAIFKLRQARIGVGSASLAVDRSGGALQVLGTPNHSVMFTSWLDEDIGVDSLQQETTPNPGDWGGLVFRTDLDNAENRFNWENQGIFLNYVNKADIRYGGGTVTIDSVLQVVNPVQMIEARPTVSFNDITFSADAAMSADPNSFLETNFHSPRYQLFNKFTSDYDRVGPDIHGNVLADNTTNGLFVRIATPAGAQVRQLEVPGRFNDTDIVHVITENLAIAGTRGGARLDTSRPPSGLTNLTPLTGGPLPAGNYRYKVVFFDANGFEGRPSEATIPVTLTGGPGGTGRVNITSLPAVTSDFIGRRLYRSDNGAPFKLVAELRASESTFLDEVVSLGPELQRDIPSVLGVGLAAGTAGVLPGGSYRYRVTFVDVATGVEGPSSDPTTAVAVADNSPNPPNGSVNITGMPTSATHIRRIYRSLDGADFELAVEEAPGAAATVVDDGSFTGSLIDFTLTGVVRARTDARLRIDPGTILKLASSRIDVLRGSQLIVEGVNGREIVFTSAKDDRFGAGGTFDTNNDGDASTSAPGNWGGIYVDALSEASIDNALLTHGGGLTRIGGTFHTFNVLEVHSGELRLVNSVLEHNADGTGGPGPAERFGRGTNAPAAIFARGAQPIIVDNLIRSNAGAVINIDVNSLDREFLPDTGRQTGEVDFVGNYSENHGPLVRGNFLESNDVNGMIVRGGELATEGVWDDVDIVHVLFDQVIIPDHHTFGGLRLQSSPTASLVVKLDGAGDSFDPSLGAGFIATGHQLDIDDRIGGVLQIIGQPDFPVVLTSFLDDTVGAGFKTNGEVQRDTNNDLTATSPSPGDWAAIRLDRFSHDRNVALVLEDESRTGSAPGQNATPATAEVLGELAQHEYAGDENLRLGFVVNGVLNANNDVDVYSFRGTAGTEVWFDADRTSSDLNTVIELIDSDGVVLARSDESILESLDPSLLYSDPSMESNAVNPLQKNADVFQPHSSSGLAKDYYSQNVHDAGMRVILPGAQGTPTTYHVRVRSAGTDPNDTTTGQTSGEYQLQIRLRELDEHPGSTIRHADIRFATNGIVLVGMPGHSPLLGETAEDENVGGPENNDHINLNPSVPGSGAQNIGNPYATDRGTISIAGTLSRLDDVDFYEIDFDYAGLAQTDENEHLSTVFDIDFAGGISRPNTVLTVFDDFGRLILISRDSNIADDLLGPDGDITNFDAGSYSTQDPFIGPVEMPASTYFVAVSSNARLPSELENPNVRLEPINTVVRVVEDHIEQVGGSTAAPPVVGPFLRVDHLQSSTDNVELMDPDRVVFYVIQDAEDEDETDFAAIEPVTGLVKWENLGYDGNAEDIATRSDGNVFGFSTPDTGAADDTVGLFQGVNPNEGQFLGSRDDGILTFEESPTNPGVSVPSDIGIRHNAVAFGILGGEEVLLAVGERGDSTDTPAPLVDHVTNLLYQLDPQTGQAFSGTGPGDGDRTGNDRHKGGGTQIRERGYLDTNISGGPGGNITGISIINNRVFVISETGGFYEVLNPLSPTATLSYIRTVEPAQPGGIINEIDEVTAPLSPVSTNNSIALAQNLDNEFWSFAQSNNIGDTASNDISTTFRHLTIQGRGDHGFIEAIVENNVGDLELPTGMAIHPTNGDLFVASQATDEVYRFDGVTGEFKSVFVAAGSGGLDGPTGVTFGPNGNLFVSSFDTDEVLEYDKDSGLFFGRITGGLSGPTGLAYDSASGDLFIASSGNNTIFRVTGGVLSPFNLTDTFTPGDITVGPTGNLFVVSEATSSVEQLDINTGTLVGGASFVASGAGGLITGAGVLSGLVFDGAGQLYVSSSVTNEIIRYDATGGPIGTFVGADLQGLSQPGGLVFDGAGNLLAASGLNDKVLQYSSTGAFVDSFAPFDAGGLDEPQGIAFSPIDGNMYVASAALSQSVLRFDRASGDYMDAFVPDNGSMSPHGVAFGPDNNLYVIDGSRVRSYDGTTGAPLGDFVAEFSGGLQEGRDLKFDPATGDLFVTSFLNDSVLVYNSPLHATSPGAFQRVLVANGDGGRVSGPQGLVFGTGPLSHLIYLSSSNNNSILRYDSTNGAFIDTLITGLSDPRQMVIHNTELLVANYGSDSIGRYDATSGAFIDEFVPTQNEGLETPVGMAISPVDGMLYVTSESTDQVFKYDPNSSPTFDFYSFTTPETDDPITAVFDIDFGATSGTATEPNIQMFIFEAGALEEENDDFSPLAGAGGSVSRLDPFIEMTLDDDTEYVVAIAEFETIGASMIGNPLDLDDTYTLHIAIDNKVGRSFESLANRSVQDPADGLFYNRVFAVDNLGALYSFDVTPGNEGQPVNFFTGSQPSIETGADLAKGLAISETVWNVTNDRQFDLGHGLTNVFDDSRGRAEDIVEQEPNNTVADGHDLEGEVWTLGYDKNIGDDSVPPINTSTFFPHVTVKGTGDGTRDFYQFEVTEPNSWGIFDIDMDFPAQLHPGGYDGQFIDAELSLYDINGNEITPNGASPTKRQDSTLPSDGDGGNDTVFFPPLEPYMSHLFATPGTYVVEVTRWAGILDKPLRDLLPPLEGHEYTLQVSIEGHRVDDRPDGGASVFFGSNYTGEIDLATAADPVVITSPGHGLVNGQLVYVQNVKGIRQANGLYVVGGSAPDTFELVGADGTDDPFDPDGPYIPSDDDFWRLVDAPQDIEGVMVSESFSLKGYASADLPTLYFNYYLHAADEHDFTVSVQEGANPATRVEIAAKDDGLVNFDPNNPIWRQARIDLGDFAGKENLHLVFEYTTNDIGGIGAEGVLMDDFVIGFAERGEMVSYSDNNPIFLPNDVRPDETLVGEYQLEIRRASDFGTSELTFPTDDPRGDNVRSLHLHTSMDTNDRLTQRQAIDAPSGLAAINAIAGNPAAATFTVSDGNDTVTFEFDTGGGVSNASHVPIPITAATPDYVVAQLIRDAINSPAVQALLNVDAGLSDGVNTGTDSTSNLVNLFGIHEVDGIATIDHDGLGDINLFRDQGQLIIESNRLTNIRDFGIVSDAGERDYEERMEVGFLGTHSGSARNLLVVNQDPQGGLTPGASIVNNVIAGAGLGGIHISGNQQPWEIVPLHPLEIRNGTAGHQVQDGDTFTVHAYRTTVTFEFEDISGSGAPLGSARDGGNTWTAGNVPVFFRRDDTYLGRAPGYSQLEMAIAIREAINSSILVTNGTSLTVRATVAPSRLVGIPGAPSWAVYLENVSEVTDPGPLSFHAFREVPIGDAAEPFARVVNNTIYGNDGTESSFAGTSINEPNDIVAQAVLTRQGAAPLPEFFVDSGTIGDGVSIPVDPTQDVDFFQVQLGQGDRLTVDIDANVIGSDLDSVVRVFNSVGLEVAFSNDDAAPGEEDSFDAYVDFTAARAGTYYIGVSGFGNETYSALDLGGRRGPASSGDYEIAVNVLAPRSWVVRAVDGTLIPDGATIEVSDLNDTVIYEFDPLNDGVLPGNTAIFIDPSPVGQNNRGPGYRTPEVAVVTAAAIGTGLNGVTAIALGGPQGQTAGGPKNNLPTNADYLPQNFGHDVPYTAVNAVAEEFIVISGATNVKSSFLEMKASDNNDNQLLPETGVLVSDHASPTLLNNVFLNLQAGVIHDDSPTTIVGASLYQHNQINSNLTSSDEDFSIEVDGFERLYLNTEDFNFYPVFGSLAIDSAVDSLEDREAFVSVKDAMGIGVSPILAPGHDGQGQLRVDDPAVSSPTGLGGEVFKDRGAVDRADFNGPTAVLINPRDNDSAGIDLDPTNTVVRLADGRISHFSVQLVDGSDVNNSGQGIGVDDGTVDATKVTITQDGQLLEEGVDYTFQYDETTNTIRLTHVSGVWPDRSIYIIRLNNEDRFVLEVPDGRDVEDGEILYIEDQLGSAVTFEFESGYSLIVPKPLTLVIPPTGVADGDIFEVSTLAGTTTFEFDANVPPNFLAGNFPVDISAATSNDDVADAIVAALIAADLGLLPSNQSGGEVLLGAGPGVSVDVTSSGLVSEGIPAVVVNTNRFSVGDGTTLAVFEFEDDTIADGVSGTRIPIHFTHGYSQDDLADAIAQAITDANVGLTPQNTGGGLVHMGGDLNHTAVVNDSPNLLLKGKPGVQGHTTLQLPGPLSLVVPQEGVGGSGGLADAQRFIINDEITRPFDLVIQEDVSLGTFEDETADANSPDLDDWEFFPAGAGALDAFYMGLDEPFSSFDIDVATPGVGSYVMAWEYFDGLAWSPLQNLIDGTNSLQIAGLNQVDYDEPADWAVTSVDGSTPMFFVRGVRDGGTVTTDPIGHTGNLRVGNGPVTFEFEDTDLDNGVAPGSLAIAIRSTQTIDEISTNIISVIASTGLGLSPTYVGNGIIDLNAAPNHVADTAFTKLTTIGSTTGVLDGETFTISNGTLTETFEFDSDNSIESGNRIIRFSAISTDNEIADAIVAAIELTALGLTPLNIGNGAVDLQDSPQYVTDVAESQLTTFGVPGGSTAIVYEPTAAFEAFLLSGDVIDAIANSSLSGVEATLRGGATYYVDGALSVGGDLPSFFTGAIADAAENKLLGNQPNFETMFTILMPNVALDFGDAPVSFPVLDAASGATHGIAGGGVILGSVADGENDGNPSANADADDLDQAVDDEDGVIFPFGTIFNPFIETPITITASDVGIIDAWIDFNLDGDWDDAGEQILDDVRVPQGSTTFFVGTPASAAVLVDSPTYARFRISSTGDLTPRGLAPDGEVEDYLVEIKAGTPPTANPDPDGSTPVAYATDEDTELVVDGPQDANDVDLHGVLANDTDVDGDPLVVFGASPGSPLLLTSTLGAAVVLNYDGSFSYDPTNNLNIQMLHEQEGPLNDTFSYQAFDGTLFSATVDVTIELTGVNDPPEAFDVGVVIAEEDGAPVSGTLDADDIDNDDQFSTNPLLNTLDFAIEQNLPAGKGSIINLNQAPNFPFEEDGRFVYSPGADFQYLTEYDPLDPLSFETVSFTYRARDSWFGILPDNNTTSNEATVTIEVRGLNDAPEARPVFINAANGAMEDGTAIGGVFDGFDADADDDENSLTYLIIDQPKNPAGDFEGSVSNPELDKTFVFDPGSDFQYLSLGETTEVTFTYVTRDSRNVVSAPGTVTITVTGVNDVPIANDDPDSDPLVHDPADFATNEDVILTQNASVIDNDFDVDQLDVLKVFDPILAAPVDDLAPWMLTSQFGASVTMFSDGTFVYDPTQAPILQALQDAALVSTIAETDGTTTISISAPNQISVASTAAPPLDLRDYLVVGDIFEVTGTSSNDGVYTIAALGANSITTSELTLVTEAGGPTTALSVPHTLVDSWTYQIIDDKSAVSDPGNPATVSITVSGRNDAPVADNLLFTIDEDDTNSYIESMSADDADSADDPSLLFRVTSSSVPAGLSVLDFGDGTFGYRIDNSAFQHLTEYDPGDPNSFQDVSFFYRALDQHDATSNPGIVTIRVQGSNDPPTANDDLNLINEVGTSLDIHVLNNDVDPEGDFKFNAADLFDYTNPDMGGSLSVDLATGVFTYTPPNPSWVGTETFTYQVRDAEDEISNVATVEVHTTDIPVARDDDVITFINIPIVIDVLNNDTDDNGLDPTTVQIEGQPSNGFVEVLADGMIRYTQDPAFAGSADSFQYSVADTIGARSNVATVDVSIVANPLPHQNPNDHEDIDDSGTITARDPLLLIHELRVHGLGTPLPVPPTEPFLTPASPPSNSVSRRLYRDPSGDNVLNLVDAFQVIDRLNREMQNRGGEGERAEGEGTRTSDALLSSRQVSDAVVIDGNERPEDAAFAALDLSQEDSLDAVYDRLLDADQDADTVDTIIGAIFGDDD